MIEHIPKEPAVFDEMTRVLRSKGALILGTPDYSSLRWRLIERIYNIVFPHSYGGDHISMYTKKEVADKLSEDGFKIEGCKSVLGAEIIFKARQG